MKEARDAARTFQDLVVWRKAHGFVLAVYRFTGGFPKQEIYGLTSQMRRAAVSIAANVAEGLRRRSKVDKLRFMNMAIEESRYYLILAQDLGYGKTNTLMELLEEASRLLHHNSTVIENSGSFSGPEGASRPAPSRRTSLDPLYRN